MNVTSLEISKRLFELSGWGDTYLVYNTANGRVMPVFDKPMHRDDYPAYDLGYLLRKLPEETVLKCPYGRGADVAFPWSCTYVPPTFGDMGYIEAADTPENATAHLCIRLIEKGVITV